MAAVIFFRCLQLICSLGIVVGGFQIGALASEIRLVFEGEDWTLASLCVRIAAVAGPIAVASVLIALIELAIRNVKQENVLKAAHPNEPWLWKPQWAAKHMRLSNKPLVIGWLCFMAVYLSTGVPLAIASQKQPFIIFAGVIGLVALLMLRMMWMSRQWNRAELRISTLPGVIGGPFSGAVILQQTFPTDTIFDVNLKCQLSRTVKRHRKTETQRIDQWSSTLLVQHPLQGSPKGTTALPVSFAIPYDATPTGTVEDETVRWILTVQKKEEVSTGGASFEIPVFKTADSRRDYEFDDELMQKHLAVIEPGALLKRFAMREQQISPDCVRFHFREFDLSIFSTLAVLSLILMVALGFMWFWITNSNTRLFAMAFPGVFLLMFLYGLVHMLFWRCRIDKRTSVVSRQHETLAELELPPQTLSTLEAESGILGFRKSISVPCDRTTSLRCKLDHRANEKESWSIWLIGEDGKQLKLLSTFNSSSEAQTAAKFLADKLGLSATKVRAKDGFVN